MRCRCCRDSLDVVVRSGGNGIAANAPTLLGVSTYHWTSSLERKPGRMSRNLRHLPSVVPFEHYQRSIHMSLGARWVSRVSACPQEAYLKA